MGTHDKYWEDVCNAEGKGFDCLTCGNTGMLIGAGYCTCKAGKALEAKQRKEAFDSIKDNYPELFALNAKAVNLKPHIDVLCKEGMNTPKEPEKRSSGQNEQFEQHLNNPLYQEASKTWLAEQIGQIKKGAEKYPEPLNPAAWTFEELFKHAVQENVDQMHYLQAMFEKFQEFENKVIEQHNDYLFLEKKKDLFKKAMVDTTAKVVELDKELKEKNEKIDNMFKDLVKYEHEIKELKEWKEKHHDRIKGLELENNELLKRNGWFKAAGETAKEEIEALHKEIDGLHSDLKGLHCSLDKKYAEVKGLEQANRELLQQNETVQHLQQENAELKNRVDQVEESNLKLCIENKELREWKEKATKVFEEIVRIKVKEAWEQIKKVLKNE